MSHSSNEKVGLPEETPVVLMLGTIADTSWRMFVPTVTFILLGVWLDGELGSKPFGLLGGVFIGFVIAGVLVNAQLRRGKA